MSSRLDWSSVTHECSKDIVLEPANSVVGVGIINSIQND